MCRISIQIATQRHGEPVCRECANRLSRPQTRRERDLAVANPILGWRSALGLEASSRSG
jgi:hypothetical protein